MSVIIAQRWVTSRENDGVAKMCKNLECIETSLRHVAREKQDTDGKLRQFEMAHWDELPDDTNMSDAGVLGTPSIVFGPLLAMVET